MNSEPLTVRTVAEWIGGIVEGDDSVRVESLASLDTAGPAQLTFAVDAKRMARLSESKAAAAIVGAGEVTAAMTLIRVDNVEAAMVKLLTNLAGPQDAPAAGVDDSAVVATDADVAADAAVGPGVVVGRRAKVGAATILCANAVVGADVQIGRDVTLAEGVVVRYGCKIGDRVRIGPNSVIGADGFGYYTADGVHHKVPHIGDVVIEDDVEIGACSCVDRAKFGSTRIGAGTKIDNLVQVAHNVQVGKGCILVGQCGIAGSTRLGDYVVLGGNAGVRDNITLGEGVRCAAFSAIAADVPDGEFVAGTPALPARQAYRVMQAWPKLPDLLKRVKKLESRLEALEPSEDH